MKDKASRHGVDENPPNTGTSSRSRRRNSRSYRRYRRLTWSDGPEGRLTERTDLNWSNDLGSDTGDDDGPGDEGRSGDNRQSSLEGTYLRT